MSDILELIKSRRNIEKFIPKPISWDKISKILEAGRHAPSSGNLQNWKFIVVMDHDKKQSVADFCHNQYSIADAFTLIIVCAEPHKAERYYGLRGVKLYTAQNCAAATQNMILEAHSLGLGTRWVGAFEEDKLKDLFSIPNEIRPQAIIAVGHAKHIPDKPPKYPLETLVYFNRWRGKIKDIDAYFNNYSAMLLRNVTSMKKTSVKVANKVSEKTKPLVKSLIYRTKKQLADRFSKNN